jgi:hypothetical protein
MWYPAVAVVKSTVQVKLNLTLMTHVRLFLVSHPMAGLVLPLSFMLVAFVIVGFETLEVPDTHTGFTVSPLSVRVL